jgi:hypothetical protein
MTIAEALPLLAAHPAAAPSRFTKTGRMIRNANRSGVREGFDLVEKLKLADGTITRRVRFGNFRSGRIEKVTPAK